ncbi:MAG: hypothetical protein KJZ75_11475 [Hyphomonadaceae bacterium]|nr:hypothetical protein [Hyphomonadaceae bacterium]
MAEAAPINHAAVEAAARMVRRTLERAERGDVDAKRDLLRYQCAEALETTLTRVAALADKCAPTLDEIKIEERQYSSDAQQLRFEVERVPNILNQAAGRAVVLEMPVHPGGCAPPVYVREPYGDPRDDNCELPKPLPAQAPEVAP